MKRQKQGTTITPAVQQMQRDLEDLRHMNETIIRSIERVNETTAALNDRIVELERKYYALVRKRQP